MKVAHYYHWHYAPPIYPEGDKQLWCQWCGFRQTVIKKEDAFRWINPKTQYPEQKSGGISIQEAVDKANYMNYRKRKPTDFPTKGDNFTTEFKFIPGEVIE
ncbi:MAG: hypothetical protein O7D95_03100 [Betaproteobacteria bacterium]|nr:hypothetical protein [Betaproteobacteria bacterium]